MAIVVKSRSQAQNAANEYTVVINKPACNVGDVLFAFYGHVVIGTATFTGDAAFTLIGTSHPENYLGQKAYYRVVDGTEAATFTFTSSAKIRQGVIILVVQGVNTAHPANAFSVSTITGGHYNAEVPSLTTTVSNCLLVYSLQLYGMSTTVATDPVGMTPTYLSNIAGSDSYHAELANLAVGAVGIKYAVQSASDRWAGIMVAIEPGGGEPYYVGKNRWGHSKSGGAMHHYIGT